MGKHSAPPSRILLRSASVATAGAVLGLAVVSGHADAATNSDQVSRLKQLIRCESGGDPEVVGKLGATSSGVPSGLWQITSGTWGAYGGKAFAPVAGRATVSEQNAVAIRISAGQGAGAWTCAPDGLRAPFAAADVAAATGVGVIAPVKVTPSPTKRVTPSPTKRVTPSPTKRVTPSPTKRVQPATARAYVVVSGDTLSRIAARTGAQWREMYRVNAKVVGSNPNLIFPGQRLVTS